MANAPTPQQAKTFSPSTTNAATTRISRAHTQQQARGPDADKIRQERAAEAKKIFDDNEKAAEDEDFPVTTQTDQLVRSMEMEQVGPTAWMNEMERRIAERQGDAPDEPRQVHGVAPAQRPR